ncbi:MAG: diguanylate cyclase [Armatimonadia bacterium]|nr:diguanylate cyclase [Armatimonadia bacterium]
MVDRTTILLAEDDPVSRRILTHLLQRSGYSVLVAEDGSEALELIGAEVQVALIDWMMPGVDGVEVCRRLKAATDGRAYAIMVTAKSEKSDIVHALDEGADDYMTKPVDHDELLARVRAAERVAQRERALTRAWAEARSEADRDSLTGLCTRRVFDEALEDLTRRPRRSPAALLMIDLDHFKRINDTHGHRVGDVVLRQVAETIRGQVRAERDVVARYGGEEIAVIAPGTGPTGAAELAERIRAQVAELHLLCDGAVVSVTVSVGVAVLEAEARGPDAARRLVEAADAKLYEAKDAGRDRVAA